MSDLLAFRLAPTWSIAMHFSDVSAAKYLSVWTGKVQHNAPRITVKMIQAAVCGYYGLRHDELIGPQRATSIVRCRHTAMWLARHLTKCSQPDIGHRFGGRDHTTVLAAVRKIEAQRAEDPTMAADIEALLLRLGVRPVPPIGT